MTNNIINPESGREAVTAVIPARYADALILDWHDVSYVNVLPFEDGAEEITVLVDVCRLHLVQQRLHLSAAIAHDDDIRDASLALVANLSGRAQAEHDRIVNHPVFAALSPEARETIARSAVQS